MFLSLANSVPRSTCFCDNVMPVERDGGCKGIRATSVNTSSLGQTTRKGGKEKFDGH